ncbi:MAG: hypothetical protein LBH14_09475 [Desulfobulbaceae bacterium]|jgi:DNA-binding response OmpR family regulator|nr:hypothetical protein [Desulfobulbaceae bacterium]
MVKLSFTGAPDDLASGGLLDEGEIIAVADSAPEFALIVQHRLSLLGFPARACHSAEEMFALFAREKVALVLLDINLPDASGSVATVILPAA